MLNNVLDIEHFPGPCEWCSRATTGKRTKSLCVPAPQGMSEEEVAEAATAAAAEAASSSSLVAESRTAGGDAQARYYNLAHRWGAYIGVLGCT